MDLMASTRFVSRIPLSLWQPVFPIARLGYLYFQKIMLTGLLVDSWRKVSPRCGFLFGCVVAEEKLWRSRLAGLGFFYLSEYMDCGKRFWHTNGQVFLSLVEAILTRRQFLEALRVVLISKGKKLICNIGINLILIFSHHKLPVDLLPAYFC